MPLQEGATYAFFPRVKSGVDSLLSCPRPGWLLQALLVGLDHLLDHLAADGAGLTGGQIAVVAVLQVDANLL